MQFKRRRQCFKPCRIYLKLLSIIWMNMKIYIVRFPLSNKKKQQQKLTAAWKQHLKMHLITTMWMFAWAVKFSTPVQSGHIMFIYITLVLYATDSLNSSSFTVLNMKQSVSVRITTWFSVIKQLFSVELANDTIFVLVGKKINLINVVVWFTEIKAWSSTGLFWLS